MIARDVSAACLEPSGAGRARETDSADLDNDKINKMNATQIFPRGASRRPQGSHKQDLHKHSSYGQLYRFPSKK